MSRARGLVREAERIIELLSDDYRAEPLARVAFVYAGLGEIKRAERAVGAASELAEAHRVASLRVDSLIEVARAYVRLGRMDVAAVEVRRAELLLDEVRRWPFCSHAGAKVAGMRAVTGSAEVAERQALAISDPAERVVGLLLVAGAAPAGAIRLVDEAERVGRAITAAGTAVQALTRVAGAMTEHGRYADAGRVADEAERLAPDTEPDQRPEAYAQVAIAFARADQAGRARPAALRAERLAMAGADPNIRRRTLQQVVEAHARTGDIERAELLAGALGDSFGRAGARSRLATVLAEAGDLERAASIARAVEPAERLLRLDGLLGVAAAASGG